jgi:hypothetical protein
VRRELAGGVGLQAREQRHADAGHLPGDVLLGHRRPGARHQTILDVGPMPLGLSRVLGEGRLELWIPGHLARSLELLQRLKLDRVDVGQVDAELLVDAGGHCLRYPDARSCGTRHGDRRSVSSRR